MQTNGFDYSRKHRYVYVSPRGLSLFNDQRVNYFVIYIGRLNLHKYGFMYYIIQNKNYHFL